MRLIDLLVTALFLSACRDASRHESVATSHAGATATAPTRPDSSRVDVPRVVETDSGPIALLPEFMAAALRRSNPQFRLWSWTMYPDSVRAHFHVTDVDGVRVVVGDFNGDGRRDVALDGTDTVEYRVGGKRAPALIAILTSGDSAIVVPIMGDLMPNGATQLSRWLRLVPAKTFRSTLVTDAVGVPTLSEPGTSGLRPYQVHFWSAQMNRFVQWIDGE